MSEAKTVITDAASLCILIDRRRLTELANIGAAVKTTFEGDALLCMSASDRVFERVLHGHLTAFRNAGLVSGHNLTELGETVVRGGV